MAFQLSKMLDVGTAHPVVARLMLGLSEIVDMSGLSAVKKDSVKSHCFEIAKHLIQVEKAAEPLTNELNKILKEIKEKGIRVQSGGAVIETPGVSTLDNARVALKYSKQALQELALVMGELLEGQFDGPHFHKILESCVKKLGNDHLVTKVLKEDQGWIKLIIDLRNEDEHPRSGRPFVRGFDITPNANGGLVVDEPRFFNNEPVLHALEVAPYNLLTFCEEMVAHTVADSLPKGVRLIEIPEKDRNPDVPKRFGFAVDGLPPMDPK